MAIVANDRAATAVVLVVVIVVIVVAERDNSSLNMTWTRDDLVLQFVCCVGVLYMCHSRPRLVPLYDCVEPRPARRRG